jgi:ribosomal protein S18 acetylase RimI-like enzyme
MKIYRHVEGVKVTLRRATDDDLLNMEIKYPDDRMLPTLSTHESWVLVAGTNPNADPVGFIEYLVRDDEVVISGLWVAPTHRGNGYGTLMLEIVEAMEEPLFVRVLATPGSAGFYKNRGYLVDQGFTMLTKVVR